MKDNAAPGKRQGKETENRELRIEDGRWRTEDGKLEKESHDA